MTIFHIDMHTNSNTDKILHKDQKEKIVNVVVPALGTPSNRMKTPYKGPKRAPLDREMAFPHPVQTAKFELAERTIVLNSRFKDKEHISKMRGWEINTPAIMVDNSERKRLWEFGHDKEFRLRDRWFYVWNHKFNDLPLDLAQQVHRVRKTERPVVEARAALTTYISSNQPKIVGSHHLGNAPNAQAFKQTGPNLAVKPGTISNHVQVLYENVVKEEMKFSGEVTSKRPQKNGVSTRWRVLRSEGVWNESDPKTKTTVRHDQTDTFDVQTGQRVGGKARSSRHKNRQGGGDKRVFRA